MFEAMFIALIGGLFFSGAIALRVLMNHEINHMFQTLDVNPRKEPTAVTFKPAANQSFVFQETTERIKK